MKQGVQSTLKLPMLREYGCYFLCVLQWAEIITGRREFTEAEIQYLYDLALERGYIRKDCTMLFPHEVLNLAVQEKKFAVTRIHKARPDLPMYVVYLVKPGHGHFVLYAGTATWDPLDPQRPSASHYSVDSYRVIT